jgi:biopolymer transport protein ExbD
MQKPFDVSLKLSEKTKRRKAVISLTPLIDVVFILLVFFMLASSFMDWQSISLDTAAASHASVSESEEKPFIVEVRQQVLMVDGESLTLAELIAKAQSRGTLTQPVSLQPMADTQVQQLVDVLDALNNAGIKPLNLLDDPQWQATPIGSID